MENKKLKKDWSDFCNAKDEIEDTTQGKELKKALYEYMAQEGWDPETRKFIDFNDDDNDSFSLIDKHTHIDHHSLLVEHNKIAVKRKPDPEKTPLTSPQKNQKEIITASCENTELSTFLTLKNSNDIIKDRKKFNEELYTYAFCKLFGKLPEVHYDQIDQLSLPFFKSKDNRAIQNKPYILIQNQCIVRKPSDKKWFKTIPNGIQKFKAKNQHLEEILEKEVSKDFLDALTP